MKKLYHLTELLGMVLLAFIFVGSTCKKSTDSDNGDPLVGTWELVKMTMYDTSTGDVVMTAGTPGFNSVTLVIRGDGTHTVTSDDNGTTETINGTWSVSGNTLTVNQEGEVITATYTIAGNTMTFTLPMTMDFDGDGSDETYTIGQEFQKQ